VTLSTIQAKYIALPGRVKESYWLKWMIGELNIVQVYVTIHCDSQSVIHLVYHWTYHERMKHIDLIALRGDSLREYSNRCIYEVLVKIGVQTVSEAINLSFEDKGR